MKSLLFLVSAVIGFSVQADVIYLRNGDRISGEIKEIWDDKVSIEPEYSDEFDIDLEDIASIATDGAFDIELFNGIEGDYTLVRSEIDGEVTLKEGEEEITLVLTDIKHLEELEDFFEWDASMSLNQTLSKGDTNSLLAVLNADLELKFGDHRTTYDLSTVRERLNGEFVKNSDRLDASYNFIFSDPWYVAMNLTTERDPIARLKRRTSLNPALGYDIFDNPGQSLSIELGVGFQNEIIDGREEEGALIDWRLRWERHFLNGDLELFHNQNIYQNLDGRENLVLYTETGLRYEITDDIFLNVQLNYETDSKPAKGTRGDNTTFVVGAGIDF